MDNKKYAGSLIRHAITVIAGAVMASDPASIEELVTQLFNNLAAGDTQALVGSSIAIFAVLWSMWNKTEDQTKAKVMTKLSLKKGEQ